MAFNEARDFLYLGSALLGAGIGVVMVSSLFPRRTGFRGRSVRGVVATFLFAFSISCAYIAFAASNGALFFDGELLIAAAILLLIALIGVVFPRTIGFPLVVASFSALILFSWAYLVYPAAVQGALLGRARIASSGDSRFWFDGDVVPGILYAVEDPSQVGFRTAAIAFDRRYPLIGGTSRVVLREISVGGEPVGRRARRSLAEMLGDPDARAFFIVPGISYAANELSLPPHIVESGARGDIVWHEGRPVFSR